MTSLQPQAAPALAYRFRGGLYLNLTNRCPTACSFCVKRAWNWSYRGRDLRLGRQEPSAGRVWEAVEREAARGPFRELVFCGYGESTYRLPQMIELAGAARRRFSTVRLRLNTIGLGNLIWGRDITGELAASLDAAAVSLNTADPDQWLELHAPLPAFRAGGFAGVLEFIRLCAASGLETTVTAVAQPGVDLKAVRRLSRGLRASFRARPFLGELRSVTQPQPPLPRRI